MGGPGVLNDISAILAPQTKNNFQAYASGIVSKAVTAGILQLLSYILFLCPLIDQQSSV